MSGPIVYETCEKCGLNFPIDCKLCPECFCRDDTDVEIFVTGRKWGKFRKNHLDLNYRDDFWLTPLMMASYGDLGGVRILLRWGANVNATDVYGWNACMHALSNGYYDIARELLLQGADPNCKSRTGQSYLDVVYHKEDEKVMQEVKEMLESSAKTKMISDLRSHP